jgi:hypothetical protein
MYKHIAIDGLTKTFALVSLSQADLIWPDRTFKFCYSGIKLKSFEFRQHTAKMKYRKFETNIPRKGIERPQSQFSHVSVSDLYIFTVVLPILLQEICGLILGIYKPLTDT